MFSLPGQNNLGAIMFVDFAQGDEATTLRNWGLGFRVYGYRHVPYYAGLGLGILGTGKSGERAYKTGFAGVWTSKRLPGDCSCFTRSLGSAFDQRRLAWTSTVGQIMS